eukprot:ctg_601.g169
MPSRLHPDPSPRKRRPAADKCNGAAAVEVSAPIPLRVHGIDEDYLSVDMDRTEEFGKVCALYRASGGEKRVRRGWLTLPRPERRSGSEGGARFLQVAQTAGLGLRRWSALLSDADEWLTDARNYDYSERERDELERAGQELLAGLRDTAGTLRHLAEAAGSAEGGAHEAAFRAAVTECIAGQIERAKRRFATMQRHRLEGMWRGDGRLRRGVREGGAMQKAPVAPLGLRRGVSVPDGRPERMATGAAAASRSDALPVDEAPGASSPPYQQQQQMEQASSALWHGGAVAAAATVCPGDRQTGQHGGERARRGGARTHVRAARPPRTGADTTQRSDVPVVRGGVPGGDGAEFAAVGCPQVRAGKSSFVTLPFPPCHRWPAGRRPPPPVPPAVGGRAACWDR